MAKIISTKKLKYDARDTSKEGIIELEVVGFKYLLNNQYLVTIRDTVITEEIITIPAQPSLSGIPGEPDIPSYTETKEVRTAIKLRDKLYNKLEIDQLFSSLNKSIEQNDSFTEKFELLIKESILVITQLDPIYGSIASDWEIKNI